MARKLLIWLSVIFIIISSILFIIYIIKDDTSRWQVSLGGIFVSALPLLLLRSKEIYFKTPLILGYYLTIILSIFLGSIGSFYNRFYLWDSSVHLYKGIYIGFFGIALFKLMVPSIYRIDFSKFILTTFILALSVSSSVVWEIYEFVGDLVITHTMQAGGNKDTMYDLLCGFFGGLIVAIYAKIKVTV
jgi:hypothetical protein